MKDEAKSPKNNGKANNTNSSEKLKKKIKKKKEKIDLLKQINPNKIANLKKTNLKNTYINKIHHLMNEDEKSNCFKDSNSDSELIFFKRIGIIVSSGLNTIKRSISLIPMMK